MPCDTIYGMVGKAPETSERIRSIKGRSDTKPFIFLIPSSTHAQEISIAEISPSILNLWPGPLTLIVPCRGDDSMALRVPDDSFLLRILNEVKPLISTSVNRSGEQAKWRISEIIADFEKDVDLILDGGDLPARKPSTILDIRTNPHKLIRHGACEVPASILSGKKNNF